MSINIFLLILFFLFFFFISFFFYIFQVCCAIVTTSESNQKPGQLRYTPEYDTVVISLWHCTKIPKAHWWAVRVIHNKHIFSICSYHYYILLFLIYQTYFTALLFVMLKSVDM